jgi:soluble lytic murein transglycosylase-like protein
MVYRTFILLLSPCAFAQDSVQSSMQSSIEKQKASVRRQTLGAVPQSTLESSSSWFTVPWVSDQPSVAAASPSDQPTQAASFACDPISTADVGPLIREAATREGIKEDLVRAVIQRESAFKPCAVSPKGAQGLMQLMPGTAKDLGVSDAFDPKQNIDGGTRYLKQLLTRYNGNMELALGAYNAGPARVDKAGGVPNIPETKTYVIEILNKLLF